MQVVGEAALLQAQRGSQAKPPSTTFIRVRHFCTLAISSVRSHTPNQASCAKLWLVEFVVALLGHSLTSTPTNPTQQPPTTLADQCLICSSGLSSSTRLLGIAISESHPLTKTLVGCAGSAESSLCLGGLRVYSCDQYINAHIYSACPWPGHVLLTWKNGQRTCRNPPSVSRRRPTPYRCIEKVYPRELAFRGRQLAHRPGRRPGERATENKLRKLELAPSGKSNVKAVRLLKCKRIVRHGALVLSFGDCIPI